MRARLIGLIVVVGLAVTACGGPGGGAATTNDGACAAVLPLARSIVHEQGRLVLIRRINGADADRLSRALGVVPPAPPEHAPSKPAGTPGTPGTAGKPGTPGTLETPPPGAPRLPKTCLVVYQGHYPPGAVTGATPPATQGDYALMVLRVRHPGVDRVLVAPTLPADTVHRSWWQRLFSMS